MLDTLQQYTVWELVLAILFSTAGVILSGVKLHYLLEHYRVRSRVLTVIEAYYVGTFFNNFIPTSVGGDVVKISSLLKLKNSDLREISLAVILERASGILLLVFLAAGFLIGSPTRYTNFSNVLPAVPMGTSTLIVTFLLLGLIVGVILWYQMETFLNFIRKYLFELLGFPIQNPNISLLVFVMSFGFHLLRAVILTVLARGVYAELTLLDALFVLPIIAFASFLPISMGGLGVREAVITFSLNASGILLQSALSVALAYRIVTLVSSLTGGILYLCRGKTFIHLWDSSTQPTDHE